MLQLFNFLSARKIFDEFNNKPHDLKSYQSFKDAIKTDPVLKDIGQEVIFTWKKARDRGVNIEPIGVDKESQSLSPREKELLFANQLLNLYRQNASKPFVVWMDNMNAAKSSIGDVPTVAKLIADLPEFSRGRRRLSTVLSQNADVNVFEKPLAGLSTQVNKAVAMPTQRNGQATAIADLPLLNSAESRALKANIVASDYDHIILNPKATAQQLEEVAFMRDDPLFYEYTGTAIRDLYRSALDKTFPVGVGQYSDNGGFIDFPPFLNNRSFPLHPYRPAPYVRSIELLPEKR